MCDELKKLSNININAVIVVLKLSKLNIRVECMEFLEFGKDSRAVCQELWHFYPFSKWFLFNFTEDEKNKKNFKKTIDKTKVV